MLCRPGFYCGPNQSKPGLTHQCSFKHGMHTTPNRTIKRLIQQSIEMARNLLIPQLKTGMMLASCILPTLASAFLWEQLDIRKCQGQFGKTDQSRQDNKNPKIAKIAKRQYQMAITITQLAKDQLGSVTWYGQLALLISNISLSFLTGFQHIAHRLKTLQASQN